MGDKLPLIILCTLICLNLISEEQLNEKVLKKKKTVCLNMIVRNESEVITRCLQSVLPFIDYWVIVDTGSTDCTQEIIEGFMKKNKIPGELHEQPWVNFGYNREEALVLAKNKGDYLLFIDADDELSYSSDFYLPDLIYDIYMVEADAGGLKYHLITFVKADKEMHWRDPIHEFLEIKDAKEAGLFKQIKYLYHHDGARGQDPLTLKKDINQLQNCLKEDPNNPRYMFYLAQSYASNNDLKNALKYYQKRLNMQGWDQEIYWSQFQIAQIQRQLNYDHQIFSDSYLKALEFRPSRPEPYYYLVNIARQNNEYQRGYELGRIGINLPESKDNLFLQKWTYDALLLEFSVCAWWHEKYDESLDACHRLLKKQNLDPEVRERALQNKQYALDKLKEQKLIDTIDEILMDKEEAKE